MAELSDWELAASPPGFCENPAQAAKLNWQPARVPGTAAAAVGDDRRDFDAEDWWFRATFANPSLSEGERLTLNLGGIATVSEIYLNGELVLQSESMWATHELDITAAARDRNELLIACRALGPLLARRRRPAARWRTRFVSSGNLRWYRTMMLGRAPGWAPGPAPVGPWRPVSLQVVEPIGVDSLAVRTSLEGDDGVAVVRAKVRGKPDGAEVVIGDARELLVSAGDGLLGATLRVPGAERWWPHTHGDPALRELSVLFDGEPVAQRRVGFRSLSWAEEIAVDGLDLHVNGVPVFCRGALWPPVDLVSLAPAPDQLRRLLELARDAGMNMLRVVGTGAYESSLFHDLCDELGILVWQDLMFALMDYPISDPDFRGVVEAEARQVLGQMAGRPSLAVVCATHDIEQQAALNGLDPALGHDELWEQGLRSIVEESGVDCAYIPGIPCGGDLPIRTDRGIAPYFGIGGYFGSLADVRRAEVRFAAECLTSAHIPDEVDVPPSHPDWKRGVPRDTVVWGLGNGWDFDDVRDLYLSSLFDVDPTLLRRTDVERYLELSRAASGEAMAEVLGEWRRASSPCRGALVLWLKDLVPGAGFGLIDSGGRPKVPYHYLRRILQPVAVWMTDEALNGIVVHAVNERPQPLRARLRVALYRDLEAVVAEAGEPLELPPRSVAERNVESVIGRFVDASYAYHFGPPGHDLIVASLETEEPNPGLLSQAVRFPVGRPRAREAGPRLGLEAAALTSQDGRRWLRVRSQRFAYCVRVNMGGFEPSDDAFSIEPGHERLIELRPRSPDAELRGGTLSALNLDGRVTIGISGA